MTGIAGCCARAASGHAAAPPMSEMNPVASCAPVLKSRAAHYHIVERTLLCNAAKLISEWQRWVDAVEKVADDLREPFHLAF